jgi:GNAT superfamily N-acetyltransferase
MAFHVEQLDNEKHIRHLMQLAVKEHNELGFGRPFDVKAVEHSCKYYLNDHGRKWNTAWVVYTDDDVPIGFLVARRFEFYHSWETAVSQEFFFVLPEYRGTRAFMLLLNELVDWAAQHKAHKIYLTVAHDEKNPMTERLRILYNKLGYNQQGTFHVRELTHDQA